MGCRWESFPRTPVVRVERKMAGLVRYRGDGGDVGHRVKAIRCKEIRFGARGGTDS